MKRTFLVLVGGPALVALVLVVSACGGSSGSSTPTAASTAASTAPVTSATGSGGGSPTAAPAASTIALGPNPTVTASGLKYTDEIVGTGAMPQTGQKVTVNYIGVLTNGTKFDSSFDRGQPFTFTLGIGQVIKGWDEGVATMRVGGKRVLYVPAALAYGSRTPGAPIPPNADLIFEVTLLAVQ